MEQIKKDIANGEIKQFYLLYGEENYLKSQYREELVKALVDVEDNMNYYYAEGTSFQLQNMVDIGNTLPFFAERRVLVLENTKLFKKAADGVDGYLENFPESTYVIFVENEVDKRNRLYKWMSQHGYASEMNTPNAKMLGAWVKGLCKQEGKQIEDSTIFYLIEHIGTDMLLLKNELEKVFCYSTGKEQITMEDIREICISQATDKIFEMLDAIGNCNQQKALSLYRDLLVLREPAMRILVMLRRHYRILMMISAMQQEGKDNKEMASVCGVYPKLIYKYVVQAKQYSYKALKTMFEKCLLTEQEIKTGKIQDIVGVELLIVEFSS